MGLNSSPAAEDARPPFAAWRFRYALLTALATLALLGVGGVVTSRGAGMAVPDWPTSYGYNMFLLPWSNWVGGAFYEHSHRLVATFVGILTVGLTRWLGGARSRLPLAIVGGVELVAGLVMIRVFPELKGAGHFLSGIGGVVWLAVAVWARNQPAARPLPALGWIAFGLVQFQGLLGGLRVVLINDELGIFHATLAQLFFVLLCGIALLCSRWWLAGERWVAAGERDGEVLRTPSGKALRWLALGTTGLILGQLVLGATMRHQHAGLAIPDFPLAYGTVWPATDPESVALYNQRRLEVTAANPITAAQIHLQMAHRIVACAILALALAAAWQARKLVSRHPARFLAFAWAGLIALQAVLGAVTIWSNKAADIATAHVIGGAASLALGAVLCVVLFRHAMLARAAHREDAAGGALSFGFRCGGTSRPAADSCG